MTSIQELASRIRSAGYVLALMEETGATDAALMRQVDYLRGLREQLNQQCPPSSLAASEFNIVQEIR